ncbi:peptidase M20 [Phenylobacterium sp. Root77]|uniref:M28 family metallopeptidase n=1 Tax=unclassified Phenylobacterium TaxID=2640670 RepID=UPI0006FA2F51|nr:MULTISPECIES: M28 family metallopeptidase [unclassified Phenylobacterium]KQW70863.1 peptidase M20 [Phenylobacterium sp. Root1277]KQW90716.1 peptidase M20 [Phenylobacterium sp. Root1290]KRC39652.1 peptidase M20 [Phenylobacterium sp. Root77]
MIRTAALSLALSLLATSALAQEPIDPARLSSITKVLASDEFQGRSPGTPGEAKTIEYLVKEFKALGLEPAGDAGAYTQEVPLLHTALKDGTESFALDLNGKRRVLVRNADVTATTLRPVDKVAIEKAPLVFVGYGVTAPERGWDDFKGVDLTGKVAVFLINDPDFEAQTGEPVAGKFGGQAATYYARWTYKFEEAARRGAIGALIIHEAPGAGYGWSTVQASNGEGFDIVRADPAKEKVLLQGWLSGEAGRELLAAAGQDFDALKIKARRADFRPVPLAGASFSASYGLTHDQIVSRNVIGKITGAKLPNESVMFAAHWDAYGVGAPDAQGRTVRPGALDDAIGVAGTMEIARAFKAGPAPARTLVFAAWTAEERGLLGSEYYGVNPTVPLETMAANLTMDVLQPNGLAKDVVLIGAGQNALEDMLAKAAAAQGRTVTPDAHPERALFYRADHFSLARKGVPVLLLMGLGGGADLVNGGREAGDRWVTEYTAKAYHTTGDAWSADWDLRGAAQDVALFYEIGKELAAGGAWPNWKDGSEFKPVRDASAAKRR